jgi:hypothetical protein
MDRKCGAFVGKEKCILSFCGETSEEGDHSDDPGVDERIMLE